MIERLRAGLDIEAALKRWPPAFERTLALSVQAGPPGALLLTVPLDKGGIRDGVWGLHELTECLCRGEAPGAHCWSRRLRVGVPSGPELLVTYSDKREGGQDDAAAAAGAEEPLPHRAVTGTTAVSATFHGALRRVAGFLRLVIRLGSSADAAATEAAIKVEPNGPLLIEVTTCPIPHTLAPWAGALLAQTSKQVQAGGCRIHGSLNIFTGSWNFILATDG